MPEYIMGTWGEDEIVAFPGYIDGNDDGSVVVTFNANGGNVSEATRNTASGTAVGELPTPTRENHMFLGWFTEADGGTRISSTTQVMGDVTYYAHWAEGTDAGAAAKFDASELEVSEGDSVRVAVFGGNVEKTSSVKVYLAWNTATASDVDMGKMKFPMTLKWAAGEVGEKVIALPVKADALVEGEEFFTLQLAGASGMELGAERACTVRIADAQERVAPSGATVTTNATGEATGYFMKKDKKGNVTAKAMPGYVFVGWIYANGKTYSTKATITDKLRKSKKVTPRFAVAHYVRALADPANGGKVTGGGKYAYGKVVALKATPTKYWSFEGWHTLPCRNGDAAAIDGDLPLLKSSTLMVTVTNDVTYFAAFKPYPKVTVAIDDTAGGTVNGAGSYMAGKVATLKATPKKGYAFTGWWDGESLVSLTSTYKYKMTENGAALSATFKKESALAKPTLTWGETNLTIGVSYSAKLTVDGESATSIAKVTGLPKGLTYKSGKVSGVPAKTGAYTATVTMALASNKKKTWMCKVKLLVGALPTWVCGTFAGAYWTNGAFAEDGSLTTNASSASASLSVSTTGKTTGKVLFAADTWTLSASSLVTTTNGGYRVKATRVNAKKKKATIFLDFVDGKIPLQSQALSSDEKLVAWKSVWISDGSWTNLSARIEGKTCAFDHAALGEVSVKVGAKGVVTVSNKGRSASGNMLVMAFTSDGAGGISSFEAEVCVRLPAKVVKKKTTVSASVVSFTLKWDGESLAVE
jgi:uncharacterized repeat protein (TIGR02543 family)